MKMVIKFKTAFLNFLVKKHLSRLIGVSHLTYKVNFIIKHSKNVL